MKMKVENSLEILGKIYKELDELYNLRENIENENPGFISKIRNFRRLRKINSELEKLIREKEFYEQNLILPLYFSRNGEKEFILNIPFQQINESFLSPYRNQIEEFIKETLRYFSKINEFEIDITRALENSNPLDKIISIKISGSGKFEYIKRNILPEWVQKYNKNILEHAFKLFPTNQ